LKIMQHYRRGVALLASLSALALAGCHHDATDTGGTMTINGTSPIATVNGQAITQQEFFTTLQGYRPTQQTLGQPAGQMVLKSLISSVLVEQLAQKQGVAPTDAQIDAFYQTQKLQTESQSVKPFDQVLAESGYTESDIKDDQIRPQIAQINLIEKGQPAITDADINAFYAQNKAQYTESDRAHIKLIVLGNMTDANRIYGQIQKGQPFSSFVSQSIFHGFPDGDVPLWVDLDGPQSPQLAQIIPPGLVPMLQKAQPGTAASSVTPPLALPNGALIAQLVEKRPKTVLPLDQVREAIRYTLMVQNVRKNPALAQGVQQQLVQFQSQAKISIPDPRYAQLLASLIAPPPPTPSLSVPGTSAPPSTSTPGG
jgi:hypothetical protein